jgi:DNA repair photolyase
VAPPSIISASRRTDIPAFFPEWFSSCLAAGTAEYRNPYSGKPAAVSLRREDVSAFVFWTRNPSPFFRVLDRLEREGYRSVFQFTLTGLPREIEPSVPPFPEAVSAFRALSGTVGPGRVLWRFDPLLPGEDPEALVARFDRVSAALCGLTERCTLSIAHPYRKSLRATRRFREIWEPSARLREAVEKIAAIGRTRGFDVRSCCTPLLTEWGVPAGACVDGELLRKLRPGPEIPASPSPVRPGCLCSASRDIGSYGTCRHGCVYCYAA